MKAACLTNVLQRFRGLCRQGIHPAFQPCAGRYLYYVRRVHTDIKAKHEGHARCFKLLLLPPFGHQAVIDGPNIRIVGYGIVPFLCYVIVVILK